MKIPGLDKWNTYAGGTAAAEGKHSYDFYTKPIAEGGAQFSISPISSQRGRHLGYRLTAFGLPGYSGHVWISPKGELDQIGKAALFSRAASAAKVAGEVYKRIGKENPPRSDDVFAKHQIAIAKKTLKMSDAGARIMGGMTKEEARAILSKHGIKRPPEDDMPENPSGNPRWRYIDNTGVEREGTFEDFRDYGGTDVTYFFRRDDGTLDLVSGSRLKQAQRIWETEPKKENPPGAEKNPLGIRDKGTFKRGAYYQYYIVYDDGSSLRSKKRYATITQAEKGLSVALAAMIPFDVPNPPLRFDEIGKMMWAIGKLREMKRDKDIRISTHSFEQTFEYVMKALDDALNHIKNTHLGGGFVDNPPLTEIYRNIIEIRAKKKDGKLYRHPFGPGAMIYGNPDGSLLIKSAKGKRLWKNFPKGRK